MILVCREEVTSQEATINIEVSPVARGIQYPPEERDVIEAVEDEFGVATIQVISLADRYGGKICAALDRQHPRWKDIAERYANFLPNKYRALSRRPEKSDIRSR